jgi:DnaK suppressor protein
MMPIMEPRGRSRLEERLRARRDELVTQGPQKIEPNRKDTATSGVADDDEQALSEMMQSLASSRNRDSAATIAAIDRALRKLRDAPEDFGTCEDCGDEISPRRLEVMPWAALCTECQSKNDPTRNVGRRKLTDFR